VSVKEIIKLILIKTSNGLSKSQFLRLGRKKSSTNKAVQLLDKD